METLMGYLIKSNVVLLVGALVYAFLFSKLTFFKWNRFLLLGLLMMALTIPFIHLPPEILDSGVYYHKLKSTFHNFSPAMEQNGEKGIKMNTLAGILAAIYMVGMVYYALKFILQIAAVVKKIKKSELLPYKNSTLAIHPNHRYSSFFRYIFIPKIENSLMQEQALLHEEVHVNQGHTWDVLFVEMMKIACWFNPAVYYLGRSLKYVHEYAADRKVISHFPKALYARLLLNISSHNNKYQVMHYFNFLTIKNRIIMMNTQNSNQWQKVRFLSVFPLAAILLMLISFVSGTEQTEKLAGNWTGSEFAFEQITGPDIGAVVEGGKALHLKNKFILKESGNYRIENPDGSVNGLGRWETSGESLTTIDERGDKTIYTIEKLDAGNLVTSHMVQMDTPEGLVKGKIRLSYTK